MAEFSRILEIHPQTLNKYLHGVMKPGNDLQAKLRELGMDLEWLMTGSESGRGSADHFGDIEYPFISHIWAGRGGVKYDFKMLLPGPPNPRLRGALYFEVKGDSMENKWEEGDLVLASPTSRPKNGGYAIACWDNDEAALKKIFYTKGMVVLQSLNPKYPPVTLDPKQVNIWFLGSIVSTIHKDQRSFIEELKKNK
jgi:transcriptional regulator with XRE-family HTH domain